MNVNEEIVKEWLHLCKNHFTIDDINFKVYGKKGGSNYSNIDILAVDNKGNYYDYEIKWRSVYTIATADKEMMNRLLKQLTRKERIEKIKGIIGNKKYSKILITSIIFLGKSKKKRTIHEKFFRENNIEVVYFEDIITDLIRKIDRKGRYDSILLQIIRILKIYNIIQDKKTAEL